MHQVVILNAEQDIIQRPINSILNDLGTYKPNCPKFRIVAPHQVGSTSFSTTETIQTPITSIAKTHHHQHDRQEADHHPQAGSEPEQARQAPARNRLHAGPDRAAAGVGAGGGRGGPGRQPAGRRGGLAAQPGPAAARGAGAPGVLRRRHRQDQGPLREPGPGALPPRPRRRPAPALLPRPGLAHRRGARPGR